MKLSEFKNALKTIEKVSFRLPDGEFVEAHTHITEVGMITKKFIDCGGVVRTETKVGFQLWKDDYDLEHRLYPEKLLNIIELSEKNLDVAKATDIFGKRGASAAIVLSNNIDKFKQLSVELEDSSRLFSANAKQMASTFM